MELPKLVRDRIPEIIRDDGEEPVTEALDDAEIVPFLQQKVVEEAREFAKDGDIEELADLLEVIHRCLELEGATMDEVERMRKEKKQERGGFDRNMVLKDIR